MTYAAIADVEALVAQFSLSGTSKPTSTQATALMADVSVEIDSVLAGVGYVVPVTTPTWFVDALGLLNAYGAAALVLRAMFPERAAAAEGSQALYILYETRYQKGLTRLQDGDGVPPELATNAGMIMPSTYLTRNPDTEENLGDIAEPTFKKAQVF